MMVKNLTFWSVMLGFLMGYVMSSGEELLISLSGNWSAINPNNMDYWKFVIVFMIAVPLAVVFFWSERRQNDRTEQTQSALIDAINKLTLKLGGDKEDDIGTNKPNL